MTIKGNSKILNNSKSVKWLLKINNDWRKRIIECSKTSLTIKHATGFKSELYLLPVKTGGIIIVTAILTNVFLYALLKSSMQKEIGLLSWIIKGMLLLVGLAGLFCETGLKNLIGTSLFLKWINHNKQSGLEEK